MWKRRDPFQRGPLLISRPKADREVVEPAPIVLLRLLAPVRLDVERDVLVERDGHGEDAVDDLDGVLRPRRADHLEDDLFDGAEAGAVLFVRVRAVVDEVGLVEARVADRARDRGDGLVDELDLDRAQVPHADVLESRLEDVATQVEVENLEVRQRDLGEPKMARVGGLVSARSTTSAGWGFFLAPT